MTSSSCPEILRCALASPEPIVSDKLAEGYVAERDKLKRELVMVEAERKDLKKEVWWLRVGGSVVLVLGTLTITSLLIAR